MDRNEAIIKAKKIQALAMHGATEGERAAARNRLQVFMKNHVLTEADLSSGTHHRSKQSSKTKYSGGVDVGEFTLSPEVIDELVKIANWMFIFSPRR